MAFNNRFSNAAIDATTLSHLMSGRDKTTIDELIVEYPNGITLIGFDYVPDKDGSMYPIFVFEEDNTKFFSGGIVLMKITQEWCKMCGTDNPDVVSDELRNAGGCGIVLKKGRTRDGRSVTTVTVL